MEGHVFLEFLKVFDIHWNWILTLQKKIEFIQRNKNQTDIYNVFRMRLLTETFKFYENTLYFKAKNIYNWLSLCSLISKQNNIVIFPLMTAIIMPKNKEYKWFVGGWQLTITH